ncbi:MAG TPA: transglycosylase domain-containing protein [Draconibacterium sp.]|nr:transglycosylase domain-containing protein [Draconibacterium sp.]
MANNIINTSLSKAKPSKKKKGSSKKKSGKFSFLKLVFHTIAILIFLAILFFVLVFIGVFGPVPSKQQLQVINNPVASEVLSAEGKVIGRYYIENRSNVKFEEISPNVVNALIATEDSRFYEHRGIDEIALLRVFVKSILLQNSSSGGGSTLSQQVAKNLYPRVKLGPISLPVNKIREAIIAYRMERIYTKEDILTLYLNTVPFSENIFGIEVASERFFSKQPKDLEIHEAAVLVGMLKANNYYNPHLNPDRAKERRNIVIDQMAKHDYITEAKAEEFKAKPLDLNYRVISYNQGPATYFMERLRPQLIKWCNENNNADGEPYNLFTDGLKITTTIDYNLQIYAQQSVKEYMKNLQGVFDSHWKGRDLLKENPDILKSALKNKEIAGKKMDEKIRTSLFTWNGLKDTTITRLDSIKHYLKFLNAGFIAIEPQTGALKAWVGGIDFRYYKFDHITAPRQTGSIFKPIVYLAALENGIPLDKYYPNVQKIYPEYQNWSPQNSHDEYGGYYTMKGALAKSLNTVSVEVLLDAGISNAINISKDLGISADLPNYPSLALGVASVSLKEIVEAYAGIVNDGKPVETHYLVEIADRDGKVLEKFSYSPEKTEVVLPQNCRAVVNMMQAVVNEGTGSAIRSKYNIEGDFAGKTGTTQENSDGWFVGITPNLVTGCWVGADDPRVHFRSITYGQGAYMALPIVGSFYSKTYSDPKFIKTKNSTFTPPSPEMLAMLNYPTYKEIMEIEKKDFELADIFRSKAKREELRKAQEKAEPTKAKEVTEEKPVWTKIKSIFKKKEK